MSDTGRTIRRNCPCYPSTVCTSGNCHDCTPCGCNGCEFCNYTGRLPDGEGGWWVCDCTSVQPQGDANARA